MNKPERILVRSVNWLGDAVMSTSALQRLRQVRPNASITLLCHEKLADLWKHQPFVDDVITFNGHDGVWATGRKLRTHNFDTALIFPNSPKSAIEAWLARIPKRIGLARPWRNAFLTDRITPRTGEIKMRKRSSEEIQTLISTGAPRQTFPDAAHHMHMYLHLVAEGFGASPSPLPPHIAVDSMEVACARKKFAIDDITSPTIGINAGAEYGPAKRWPAERFIDVARKVQRKVNCRWLLFGGTADVGLAEQISAGIREQSDSVHVINLAGRTSLRELCAAFQICTCVVTNDTGPMHLAAAVGTKVIVPFGSTSPELTGPGLPSSQEHTLLRGEAACAPCFLRECPIDFRCLSNISADLVAEKVLKILAQP